MRLNVCYNPNLMEPTPFAPQPSDEEKRRQLIYMKRIATGLLGVSAVVFLIAHQQSGFGWGLVRAISEASMVGGLADWFAVTALFRHPMGIPIPHTAIISKNKDRIGAALGNFVYKHFLTPELIKTKLTNLNLGERIGEWLANPEKTRSVLEALTTGVTNLLDRLNDDDIRAFIRQNISDELLKTDLAPRLGRMIDGLMDSDRFRDLLDFLLLNTAQGLDRNKEKIEQWMDDNLNWVQRTFLKQVVRRTPGELLHILDDQEHRFRKLVYAGVQDMADNLQENPEWHLKLTDIKQQILQREEVRAYLGDIWTTLKIRIQTDLTKDDSQIKFRLQQGAASLGEAMLRDEAVRNAINRNVEQIITEIVTTRGSEVAIFISDTVRKWDAQTMVDRVEINIGRDLQFVRINGTIVGGLVGALLFLITRLF